TKVVVTLLEDRDNDVQSIGCTALKNGEQDLACSLSRFGSTREPGGREAERADRGCGVVKKATSRNHDHLFWKSGDAISIAATADGDDMASGGRSNAALDAGRSRRPR